MRPFEVNVQSRDPNEWPIRDPVPNDVDLRPLGEGELKERHAALSSQSGVNLDEETARVSTLQNQYTAASELIKVINDMFSSLMTAVQSVKGTP